MSKYTKDEILDIAREEDVRYIRLQFTGLNGTIKNVEIPLSQLPKALDNDILFDGSSIEGFVRIQESDMLLYPDLDTWMILDWEVAPQGKVARLICDIYRTNRTPFEGDPRSNLKRVAKEMEELGFTEFNLGIEPEFFLFNLDENGKPTLEFNDEGGYFDLAPVDLAEDCRRDIVLEMERVGFEVEASHHEVAAGQHEINFKFANVVAACDNIQTFKLIVKNIAKRHGLHATFMPKPVAKINGSGMHTNCSLSTKKGNAFYDPDGHLQLSDVAHNWIAGILKHARAFTAITNPTNNSYKRLVPGYEAPCYVSWSDKNRSALIRIPASRGSGTRTEVRSVDPSANPYLAMAVILASGLDGIKHGLEAPAPVYSSLYDMSDEEKTRIGVVNLPINLGEALDCFKADEVLKNALGPHIVEKYLEMKYREYNDYLIQVSQYEIDTYFNL